MNGKELDIPLEEVFYDPVFNCRGTISSHTLVSLREDIRKNGLLQRIIVAPYDKKPGKKYRVIAGHRRFLVIKSLALEDENWKKVPSIVAEGLSELQLHSINLRENIERKDLNIVQEANGIKAFREAGWTIEETAKELSQPKGWVQLRFKVLDLEPKIQEFVAAGVINQQQIPQIASAPRGEARIQLVNQIRDAKLKGTKPQLRPNKKTNPLKRKKRDSAEVFRMNTHIMDTLGPCLATRVLAWCHGDISDADVYRDIKKECEEQGKTYEIPENVLPLFNL